MSTKESLFKKIISHAKEYGFVFPSSEIYEGLSAVYDYGQNGVELKNNIKAHWWKAMVQMNENIVGLDSAIFMHPSTWIASGHVEAFNDPLIDNKDSKKRYRADVLIEDHIEKIKRKIEKEIDKAAKRFGSSSPTPTLSEGEGDPPHKASTASAGKGGETLRKGQQDQPAKEEGTKFDKELFLSTNQRVLDYQAKIDSINKRFQNALEKNDLSEIKQIIVDLDIADPESGSKNWTDVRQFNLMFETEIGSVSGESNKIYLRPETAQGIFVNFLNVQKTGRMKIPFGIAQIGKAFRNEIIARQFIFRMKEFEQMEMQFFVKPGEEMKWYDYWKEERVNWYKSLGLPEDKLRFHEHLNLAHYANAAVDIEFDFPIGFKEIEGIHSRTDFDLSAHEKLSGKKLQYFDHETNESYIPYVVETSMGLDRMFMAILSHSYTEEQLPSKEGEDGALRVVLKIIPSLAPVKAAVFPLIKKDGLPEAARKIFDNLKIKFNCQYEEKDTIGKRYRRQDAIGTPYCITVDHQSLKDNTVTVRDRDTMKQERIPIENVEQIIEKKINC